MEITEFIRMQEVPNNFTGIARIKFGTIFHFKNGMPHRDDGPAIIYPEGSQYWYKNGKAHRTDGPAVISVIRGLKTVYLWYLNGNSVSAEEVFREMTSEQKMNAVWEVSTWGK